MAESENAPFDIDVFLGTAGLGRSIVLLKAKQVFFSQGKIGDCIFYLRDGRAKLTVVSKRGKEATLTIFSAGDFVGETSVARSIRVHMATATALTACTALKINRTEMMRAIHEEHAVSDMFLDFVLARNMRIQADLVDRLLHSSEERLARALLLMADFDRPGKPERLILPITQEALAEMIGSTRSRVNFFMNRFRRLGFIRYKGRICVHKSLISVFFHDYLPGRKPVSLPTAEVNKQKTLEVERGVSTERISAKEFSL